VESQIILSTIHGAKGLEWDYIILSEQWVLTFICRLCTSTDKNNTRTSCCRLSTPIPDDMIRSILDDLCVCWTH